MQRDRDEWRRPWTEGEVPAPVATTAPSAAFAAEPRLAGGWDAAYDPVEGLEPAPDRSGTFTRIDAVRQPVPTVAPPTLAPPTMRSGAAASGRVRQPRRRGGTVLTALVAGAVGAAVTLAVVGPPAPAADPAPGVTDGAATSAPEVAAPTPERPSIDPTRDVIPQVAEVVKPSVVRIDVRGGSALQGDALGSGVIYREDGYIVTNFHVIEAASEVSVTLATGGRLPAEVVGTDALNDLAVLRIERDGLPAIAIRSESEPLLVGETVVAIGSPFGLDASVTAGIVSALNRDLPLDGNDLIPAVIQTDAAINPGNSGGALVDLQGRLVGINTAIFSRSGSNEGIGFAVTSSQAVSSAEQLIRQGFVRYPLLGITGTDVSAEVAAAFGLPDQRGAVIESVQDGSGADLAGMRSGDVVVAVDGVPLASMSQLVSEVRRRIPGDVVRFTIVREGTRLDLSVTLGERPRD